MHEMWVKGRFPSFLYAGFCAQVTATNLRETIPRPKLQLSILWFSAK